MTRDPIEDLMDHPAPIPDDGFTLRVMGALPPPRRAPRRLDAWLALLGAGAVAAALAPDLAELGRGLAASTLQAELGATRLVASVVGGVGLQGPALLVAAMAAAAAVVGSWLLAEPS